MNSESAIPEWLQSLDKIIEEMKNSPPRTRAVLSGALIEDQLKRLVASSLIDDRAPHVKSISYAQLSLWAYRLGAINGQTFSELKALGEIRNAFAHDWSPDLSFESQMIRSLIDKLAFTEPSEPSKEYVENLHAFTGGPYFGRWFSSFSFVLGVLGMAAVLAKKPTAPEM